MIQALGGLLAPVGVEYMISGPDRTGKALFFMACLCVCVFVKLIWYVSVLELL